MLTATAMPTGADADGTYLTPAHGVAHDGSILLLDAMLAKGARLLALAFDAWLTDRTQTARRHCWQARQALAQVERDMRPDAQTQTQVPTLRHAVADALENLAVDLAGDLAD